MTIKEMKKTIGEIQNLLQILITFLGILIAIIELYEEIAKLKEKKDSKTIDITKERHS